MDLVPEIDVKQTRDKARKVLKSYRILQRRSGIVVSLNLQCYHICYGITVIEIMLSIR